MCMEKFVEILLKHDPTPLSIKQIHEETGITTSTLSRNKSSLINQKPIPEILMVVERKTGPHVMGTPWVYLYKVNHEHPWYPLDKGGKK